MSEKVPRRRMSPFTAWLVLIFLIVVLYLGSFGPVNGLHRHGYIERHQWARICNTVYFPLKWIEENTNLFHPDKSVGNAYRRYVGWFEP